MDTYINDPMLNADLQLDLSQVKPLEDNEVPVLPAGKYTVRIAHAETRTSKATGNPYINLRYDVVEGEYAGRGRLFDMFAVWSDNPEFALRRFRALREAVGLNPSTGGCLAELLEREMVVRVATRESRRSNAASGELENVVKQYLPAARKPAPAAPAPKPSAAPKAMAAPAPAQAPVEPSETTGSAKPWE